MMFYNDVYRRSSTVAILIMATLISACSGGGDSSTATSASTNTAAASDPPAASATSSTLKITGVPPATAVLGTAYYFKTEVTGATQGTVSYSIQNKPAWATLNTATGELKGAPTTTGRFANIAIEATDGHTTAKLSPFSIQVLEQSLRVTLTWDAPTKNTDGSSIDNLAGFAIHYGVSPTALNKVVKVGSNTARSYLFTDLSKGTTYYFAVAAVNAMDVEGALSPITSLAL